MHGRPGSLSLLTTFLLALCAGGCATSGSGRLDEPVPADGFCFNGLLVRSQQPNVKDELERRLARRVPEWLDPRVRGPLVLVDGIEVDGLYRLATMSPAAIATVETLDANRAVPEYGLRARDGAIVVLTKEGLTAGASARRPDARPVPYCGRRRG